MFAVDHKNSEKQAIFNSFQVHHFDLNLILRQIFIKVKVIHFDFCFLNLGEWNLIQVFQAF